MFWFILFVLILKLIVLFSVKADAKETDLWLNDETSSNKEKGNVINSELGSETCDTHTWCDAGLGDCELWSKRFSCSQYAIVKLVKYQFTFA